MILDLSNPYVLLSGIITLVGLVLALAYIVVPLAIKKGYPVEKYLESADKNIDVIKGAIDTVGKIAPIPQLALVDKILVYADKAVQEAEQLYKVGKIQSSDRRVEAKDYILNLLKLANVELTPELEKVIDGSIEAGVFVLPKTGLVEPTSFNVSSQPVDLTIQSTIAKLHSGDSAPDLTKDQPQV